MQTLTDIQTYTQSTAENIISILNIHPTPEQAKRLVEILDRYGFEQNRQFNETITNEFEKRKPIYEEVSNV